MIPNSRPPDAPVTLRQLTDNIRAQAKIIGFDAVGITNAGSNEKDAAALAEFIRQGRHGDMAWMPETMARRSSPTALWPEARSVIALGMNYAPSIDPLAIHQHPDKGAISVYAQGHDYHDIVKKRLKVLARWVAKTHDCDVKVFVDTAPVMEKPLASRAGLGWQGKHTNMVSREFGSWLFLGEIFTTLELAPDMPVVDHCGSCNKCRIACPTGALDESYRMDATRCISYLTIEHHGDLAPDLMAAMGNRIYGCDDCLSVCPWNKFSTPTKEQNFLPRAEITAPRLADLLDLDDAGFRQVFSGSPIKRTGRDRMVRNTLIAAGNSKSPELLPMIRTLLDDTADVVRHAARWAEKRLGSRDG